jgi:hypothetical protein
MDLLPKAKVSWKFEEQAYVNFFDTSEQQLSGYGDLPGDWCTVPIT